MDHFDEIRPYDPLPPSTGDLTVNVQVQFRERDDWDLGMVRVEKTGRTRIVIEGRDERVGRYLKAVMQIVHKEKT